MKPDLSQLNPFQRNIFIFGFWTLFSAIPIGIIMFFNESYITPFMSIIMWLAVSAFVGLMVLIHQNILVNYEKKHPKKI